MDIREERAFEAKAEKMLAGHRGLLDGRDFRWNTMRYRSDLTDDFRTKFDTTFPESPGSPAWFDRKFGPKQ